MSVDPHCCSALPCRPIPSFSTILIPSFTYSGSSLSSRQQFGVHDGRTVISVDWFGARRTSGGERWYFDLLESWTELRVVRRGSIGDDRDGDDVPILVDAVLIDGRQRRGDLDDDVDADKDPFRFNMLPGGSDGFVFVLLHGPGGVDCADWSTNLSRDPTLERTRVKRKEGEGTEGPPRIFYSSSASMMMWPFLPRAAW